MRFANVSLLAVALLAAQADAAPPEVPKAPVLVKVGERPATVAVKVPKEGFGVAPAFAPEDVLWFPGETDAAGVKTYLVQPYKAGVYRVVFWVKGETEYSVLVIDATGGGPNPPPPPPPDPTGLGLKKASADGLAQVADQDRRDALARQQRAHASAVAAGAFASPAAILAGWRAANNQVQPDLTRLAAWQAKWKPWATAVSAKLQELYAAGKLPDNASWAKAFGEIADGLEVSQ